MYKPPAAPCTDHPPPAVRVDDPQLSNLHKEIVFLEFAANQLILKFAEFCLRLYKTHWLYLKHLFWAGIGAL
jgi:hypothetical protein